MVCLNTLLALSVFAGAAFASTSKPRNHAGLAHKVLRATKNDGFEPSRARGNRQKRSAAAKRCAARSSTSSSAAPKTTLAIGNPAGDPETTTTAAPSSSTAPTKTTSSEHHTTTTKTSGGGGGGGGGGSGGGDGGNDVKPANWPTKTQSGNTYEATRATASDPYLLSISEVSECSNAYS